MTTIAGRAVGAGFTPLQAQFLADILSAESSSDISISSYRLDSSGNQIGLIGPKGETISANTDATLRRNSFELIAHRGFGVGSIENTTLAFSLALERGADSLETDVSVSSDGVLYTFHDAALDTLTNGTGNFKSVTSTYIDARVFDAMATYPLSGVGISRFSDFLNLVKERRCKFYPEVKGYRTSADIALMVQAATDAGVDDLCCWSSFIFADLPIIRQTNSTVGIGYLGSLTSNYQSTIDALAALGNATAFWSYTALLTTPAIVTYCRSKGVDVIAWTVNDMDSARKLMQIGVNKLVSDVLLRAAK